MSNFELVSRDPGPFLSPYAISNSRGHIFRDYTFYPKATLDGYLDLIKAEVRALERRTPRPWLLLWDARDTSSMYSRAVDFLRRAHRLLGDDLYNEAAGRVCYVGGARTSGGYKAAPLAERSEAQPWTYFYMLGVDHGVLREERVNSHLVQLFEDKRLRVLDDNGERMALYPKYGSFKLVQEIVDQIRKGIEPTQEIVDQIRREV